MPRNTPGWISLTDYWAINPNTREIAQIHSRYVTPDGILDTNQCVIARLSSGVSYEEAVDALNSGEDMAYYVDGYK